MNSLVEAMYEKPLPQIHESTRRGKSPNKKDTRKYIKVRGLPGFNAN